MDSAVVQFIAGALGAVLVVVGAWVLRGRRERRVEPAPQPYVEGLRLLIDGRKAEAFGRLQAAVIAGNAPTDAYIRIGAILRERGDAAKALQIHKSLTVKSDLTQRERVEVLANVADDYVALGHAERALETVDGAMRRSGFRDPTLVGIAARACHLLGRTEEAYEYLKELRKAGSVGDREMALYLVSVAEVDAAKGRARDARKTLTRALRHDSECAPALLALGRLEEATNDVEDAIRLWRQAARVSPDLAPAALRSLERVLYQRGTFNEIEAVYREVLESRPADENAALALASFYRKQGRVDDAITLLEDYRTSNPDSIKGTMLLTSIYAARGDTDELEALIDRNGHGLSRTRYRCGSCGWESEEMRWHCPRCNRFDTFLGSAE
jgi:lipopolysaccharide assembly protein B